MRVEFSSEQMAARFERYLKSGSGRARSQSGTSLKSGQTSTARPLMQAFCRTHRVLQEPLAACVIVICRHFA